jgi:aerobic carbon-monoxide dehydrogenase small subunit
MEVSLTLNGSPRTVDVAPRSLLAQVLRDDCGLDDVRLDCETSTCGACTVLLDGDAVKSCAVLAPMADGSEVTTVSGLPRHDRLGAVLSAIESPDVLPCGECLPAVSVVTAALVQSRPDPSAREVARALSGTVCRCTGYASVVDAVVAARTTEAT